MQSDIDPRSLIGRKVFDRDGAKIGTVDEVYLDDATGEPLWAAVRTGFFRRDAFIPLATSEVSGESLRTAYDRALIKEAPDFGVGRHLSPEQELQLYHHYRLTIPGPEPGTGLTPGPGTASNPGAAGPGPGPGPEPGPESSPEPGPESGPESRPGPESGPEPESRPESGSELGLQPRSEPGPGSGTRSESGPE
ncbi:PRC-barrel domain containing protein [Streptomyces rectiverticillatus]|nr:PRC-barrel domain containing protein [Streptomyces rectiverticillatus]